MRITTSLLITFLVAVAVPAYADRPAPTSQELRQQIRERAIALQVDKLQEELTLSEAEKAAVAAIVTDFASQQLALRREGRAVRERARAAAKGGDDAKAKASMAELFAHKQRMGELEASRAAALERVLGASRALRATLILSRLERRIEQRMRHALRGHRGRRR